MVRVLADGNNLMYALRESSEGAELPARQMALEASAGRHEVCRLLGELAEASGLDVAVVFDGPAPAGPLAEQIGHPRVQVYYGERRKADDVLAELIAAHSAPRRLTVVSSDGAIRRLARRRDCRAVKSEEFAAWLLAPPPARPAPVEPAGKRAGLRPGELERWLQELGLSDEGASDDVHGDPPGP